MGALFLAFGLAFEIPIAVILLCKMGITDVETLSRSRSYVIVASFVIGMLLTPPDIIISPVIPELFYRESQLQQRQSRLNT